MNYLPFRIWLLVSIALAISAVMVRLVWEATISRPVSSMVIIALCILVTLGVYALILCLTIRPSLKKLRSMPIRICGTIIITAALIGGIIHYIRFVPSPEAASPLSVVIATLLLLAGISAYPLALLVIWRKGRKS
ncbi:MAG: hypothetical protein PHE15_02925 [Dehalococcoidales bacterium]|nr:hypothetical protein [Dehalococcoidales bacterium]